MRILVTGASGFVGGHLAPALVGVGHDVFCAVRDPSGYAAPEGATTVTLDLDEPSTSELPETDAVIHLAQANVRFPEAATELFRVNTASTQELLDHARRVGAERFLLASTGSVYGFGGRPFAETDPLSPHDFYATTKIASEHLVRQYEPFFATAVFRLVVPYGPGQQARMIPRLIDRVRSGEALTVNEGGHPRLNPIYIDDVVRLVLEWLELPGNAVVNIGGDEPVGVRELGELIGRAVSKEPVFEDASGGPPGDVVVDTTRMKELFGLGPLVPLEEGLRRTAAEIGFDPEA
jgi:nucleoside-diphosphate-sugar epimerase